MIDWKQPQHKEFLQKVFGRLVSYTDWHARKQEKTWEDCVLHDSDLNEYGKTKKKTEVTWTMITRLLEKETGKSMNYCKAALYHLEEKKLIKYMYSKDRWGYPKDRKVYITTFGAERWNARIENSTTRS